MQLKQRGGAGVYYVHFTGPEGQRLRLSTGESDLNKATLKAASIVRAALTEAAAAPSGAFPEAYQATLEDYLKLAWERRWQHDKGAASLRVKLGKLIRLAGHVPASQINHEWCFQFLESLTISETNPTRLKPATKNRYKSMISTAFTEAHAKDPSVRVPKLPSWDENNIKERYLERDEERRILDHFTVYYAPGDVAGTYLRDLFIVLLDTGMRASEALVTLTYNRLTPSPESAKFIHLPHGMTKNGKGRQVPLTNRAREAVLSMLASPLHGTQNSNNMGKQFKNLMDRLGIEEVTLHTLRHTCASRLVQGGVKLYEVSHWLGHRSMETTRRYAHLEPDALMGALSVLETEP